MSLAPWVSNRDITLHCKQEVSSVYPDPSLTGEREKKVFHSARAGFSFNTTQGMERSRRRHACLSKRRFYPSLFKILAVRQSL